MKATFITAIAALASSVLAAPNSHPGVDFVSQALSLDSVDIPSAHTHGSLPKEGIIEDLAPEVGDVLEVTGFDGERLLIQLGPEVAALLAGLNLPELGIPVGYIIATASTVGELLADLGAPVENLLTVIGEDGSYLLIELAPGVSALLTAVSLPELGIPVGVVVATLGRNLKRSTSDSIKDLAPVVRDILEIIGLDGERLLIQLGAEIALLVAGLGLPEVGVAIGSVIASATTLADLLADLGAPVENLLTVIGEDGSYLLIKLSPAVAALLTGLGLPQLGVPVGAVIATLGLSL